MHLLRWSATTTTSCFPRAHGDAPGMQGLLDQISEFSPCTRGCTRHVPRRRLDRGVFPVHTGMHPALSNTHLGSIRFPRAHGDAPSCPTRRLISLPFSPCTRGCTSLLVGRAGALSVFPVHTGMHPDLSALPARSRCFPRAHGDAPLFEHLQRGLLRFSPCTRGCTSDGRVCGARGAVFPVHTGMHRFSARSLAPRAGFSPCTRGCTREAVDAVDGRVVFPVHTGMHPHLTRVRRARHRFPRAHGDAPHA